MASNIILSTIYVYITVLLLGIVGVGAYRVLDITTGKPNGTYFKPFDRGFVGVYGEPSNFGRERINEGALETPTQELLFESPAPRQTCPGMIGPFSDGNYYCTAREYGYCDRRSGTCFCNIGYQGYDCSECQGSHFRVGNLCYPKKLCEKDCSGAGTCDFSTGKCSCLPHRTGAACDQMLCSNHSSLCESCTQEKCLRCQSGYYLTQDARVCSSCYDFDPRCSGCTKEQGCTVCADPILTSVRRSGYRDSDPDLPLEEETREFSITLPFGTKSPESFADAENFFVKPTTDPIPLKNQSTRCIQGVRFDDAWDCYHAPATHIVCGHYGVFTFEYPNYVVYENTSFVYITVRRSGGGYGSVNINYYIRHFSTNDSDVSATAYYTTSQKLKFNAGIVSRTFLIQILDDNVVEGDEVFQLVLEVPEGGGSVGAQFRANVTIKDDDMDLFSAKMSKLAQNTTTARAGAPFSINLNAAIARNGAPMTVGGELFVALLENYQDKWANPGTASGSQRHTLRQSLNVHDNGDGTYTIASNGVKEQGRYQFRVFHAFPGGLKGQYYYDGFFQKLALERIDRSVNFTWGSGRLITRVADYLTIRWSGALRPDNTGLYYFKVNADDNARLWINGDLLLDHWQELAVNLEPTRQIYLEKNKLYEIILEYREIRGDAYAYLLWGMSKSKLSIIPANNLYSLYEVDRSPAEIIIKSDYTVADKTECTGSGLFGGVSLQMQHFSFCPRDRFGNLRDDDDYIFLTTALFQADLYLIDDLGYHGVGSEHIRPLLTFNNDTSCFDGQYIPERAGLYRMDIKYQSSRMVNPSDVAGSPFYLEVVPTETFGPYSNVIGLPQPLHLNAGSCENFTIQSRDFARNLRFQGGDNYDVYMYQVDYYSAFQGHEKPVKGPTNTKRPTSSPTSEPSQYTSDVNVHSSPALETTQNVVRYGVVYDHGNGNYTAQLCPVIAGWYEIHVLLNSKGVSNQNFRILDKYNSYQDALGINSYSGHYVDKSPYTLIVSHYTANAHSSTAVGPGLLHAVVGIPNSFTVTVRDSWDNVLRSVNFAPVVSAKIDRTPQATVSVWNYYNGSYLVEYVANVSGSNLISVYVNNMQISGSPFQVYFDDGKTSARYSYAVGRGLYIGTTGVKSYFELYSFDLDNNRKTTSDDKFKFVVSGANNYTGYLVPCPTNADSTHPACNPYDNFAGHYYGEFVPSFIGTTTISVYLYDASTKKYTEISNSPFHPTIHPSGPISSNTDISGVLYDNEAGVQAFINIHLRDAFNNLLESGGARLELALIGVAVEWGTIEPWGTTPGLQDDYHYHGFYSGYPNYYGTWVDHYDGSYTGSFNVDKAGQYVLRLALAEEGLNATYFNTTDFGYLVDQNFNLPGFTETKLGDDVNVGTAVSWTGDVGRRPGSKGDIGQGSYYYRFMSRVEPNVNFKLNKDNGYMADGHLGSIGTAYRFRNEYWSARWVGTITPLYKELYNFLVQVDASSYVRLRIGGLGSAFNQSNPGTLILDINEGTTSFKGTFNFTDLNPQEIVVEYVHYVGESFLSLLWESPSTPLQVIPSTAFHHWDNISHYNMTIHPTKLCSSCSTAYGSSLHRATVGALHSFVIYARDRFGNLLQTGGDEPSMVAVGPQGVAFRGDIVDYGNSTYLISYYPTVAGKFRMYVTLGCCAPHPNVGLPAELEMFAPLLIQGAPFDLVVSPARLNASRTVAVGDGITGGIVGFNYTVVVLYRDLHNNPTSVSNVSDVSVKFEIFDNSTGNEIIVPFAINYYQSNATIVYNMTRAGKFRIGIQVKLSSDSSYSPISGSPFLIGLAVNKPEPQFTQTRGIGMRSSSPAKNTPFEIQLYDIYRNPMTFGSSRFYIRLIGDATFSGSLTSLPTYIDEKNGKYRCNYVASYSGPHHLDIRLLNSSRAYPGGTGLTAFYYTSLDHSVDIVPFAKEIVPNIDYNWPNGDIVPNFNGNVSTRFIHNPNSGQSVVWEGYLVSPRSDSFAISVDTNNMNVTVFIDESMIFDTVTGIATSMDLVEGLAYRLRVEGSIVGDGAHQPVSASLMWQTITIRKAVIPKYFLYDSAEPIFGSPFPISIA